MSKRYIELYSRNRNRTEFPLPSSYEVPFAPTRQILSASFSTDPICTGAIYYTWSGGNSTVSPNSYIITGATLSPGYTSTYLMLDFPNVIIIILGINLSISQQVILKPLSVTILLAQNLFLINHLSTESQLETHLLYQTLPME